MTREEMLKWLEQIEKDIYVCSLESTFADDAKSCAIHEAIKALSAEPCGDAISRMRVFSAIHNTHLPKEYEEPLWNKISDLPPVQPSRPKGEWIATDYDKYPETYPKAYQQVWETDAYGKVIHRAYGGERNIVAWMPYITPEPYCGADMRGEEE